jgi:hypothetical protein
MTKKPKKKQLSFTQEAEQARAEFAAAVLMYPVAGNLQLRTKADTLLIMFDQMVEHIGEIPEPCQGCDKHKYYLPF